MREYIKLLRVKHYIKNGLVFLPLFFAGKIFDLSEVLKTVLGFVCFCLVSSAVYILNDYRDIEKDRKHPTKKERPLASGKIKPVSAIIIMALCLIGSLLISLHIKEKNATVCLILYFVLNVLYSMGLKNKPIVDIVILASGFVIRTFYGGFIIGVEISKWLYLVITTGSLYMGLGKRRNEISRQTDTREVLKYYNLSFLDKNMYVCLALTNVFYSLWTIEMPNKNMIWTVPIVIIILMCYSLDVEGESDGDPVEVILKDKILVGIIFAYVICIFCLIYIF